MKEREMKKKEKVGNFLRGRLFKEKKEPVSNLHQQQQQKKTHKIKQKQNKNKTKTKQNKNKTKQKTKNKKHNKPAIIIANFPFKFSGIREESLKSKKTKSSPYFENLLSNSNTNTLRSPVSIF